MTYYDDPAPNPRCAQWTTTFMRENDPRMPLFNERKTKVTFGNGSLIGA